MENKIKACLQMENLRAVVALVAHRPFALAPGNLAPGKEWRVLDCGGRAQRRHRFRA
jgi:hypothetical protein